MRSSEVIFKLELKKRCVGLTLVVKERFQVGHNSGRRNSFYLKIMLKFLKKK